MCLYLGLHILAQLLGACGRVASGLRDLGFRVVQSLGPRVSVRVQNLGFRHFRARIPWSSILFVDIMVPNIE